MVCTLRWGVASLDIHKADYCPDSRIDSCDNVNPLVLDYVADTFGRLPNRPKQFKLSA